MRSTLAGGLHDGICDSLEPDICGAAATCNWTQSTDSEVVWIATDKFAYR
jgi:hypothetical protein